MLYRILLLILLSCLTDKLNAQSKGIIPLARHLECSEIAYSSSALFAQLIQQHQYDSAQQVLSYWEGKCGMREPIFRAKIVLAFVTDQNVDTVINDQNLQYLTYYTNRVEMIRTRSYINYNYNKAYYGYVPVGQDFDLFTVEYFKEQCLVQKPGTINDLISEYYSNNTDTLFASLQKEQYNTTNLSKQYYNILNIYKNKAEVHIAALAGVWIPTGSIVPLGIHPELGMQLGAKRHRLNGDLTIVFKFLNSKNYYYATRVHSDKSVIYTNKFFGGYIGLDAGYDVWYKKRNEIQFLMGLGFDGFDVVSEDKDKQLKSESAGSYNFNFGMGYRYYINHATYVGLRVKYNIVDYTSNNVVNFTGNPITVAFTIGCLGNTIKEQALSSLKYKWRQ